MEEFTTEGAEFVEMREVAFELSARRCDTRELTGCARSRGGRANAIGGLGRVRVEGPGILLFARAVG